MHLHVSTLLPCTPECAWHELQATRLLRYVSRPVMRFRPLDPPRLPETWTTGRYLVGLRLFGWLPLGTQWIVPTLSTTDARARTPEYALLDAGESALLRRFTHRITIAAGPDGTTRYTDDLTIDAGMLTPLIGFGALLLFRHRQRRWRRLAYHDFDYRR